MEYDDRYIYVRFGRTLGGNASFRDGLSVATWYFNQCCSDGAPSHTAETMESIPSDAAKCNGRSRPGIPISENLALSGLTPVMGCTSAVKS